MPFVSEENFKKLNSKVKKPAELINPINENEPMMRCSLFEGLFSAINLNVKKGYSSLKVFESGNVFYESEDSFIQHRHISGIVYYHDLQKSWDSKVIPYDFYSLKAEIFQLLKTLGVDDLRLEPNSVNSAFNLNSMDIYSGKKVIGSFGEIDIVITQKLIKNTAFGFELYPEEIPSHSKVIALKAISKFPSSTRDMNVLISKSYSYYEIEKLLLKGKIKFLNSLSLANTFEGQGIEDNSISMTLRFTFQSAVKSLQESEINESMKHAFDLLNKALKAKIRS